MHTNPAAFHKMRMQMRIVGVLGRCPRKLKPRLMLAQDDQLRIDNCIIRQALY